MSYLELSLQFFELSNGFSDFSFPFLELISIDIELGDVCGDKIGSLCAEHSRGCMEKFCLSPTLRRKQGKVSSNLILFEKCLCVLKILYLFVINFFVSLTNKVLVS